MNTLGDVTKVIFEHDPEAHKLHLEFVVATGQTVHKGDLVILNADGTVQAAAASAAKSTIIGVSIHDGAADDFVTIAMKGYTVVFGEAAADNLDAGPVVLGAWNGTTSLREYAAGVITALDAGTVDGTYGAEEAAVINNLRTKLVEYETIVGHALVPAALNGDSVKVCLLS